jgi:hypothetical protein
LLKGDTVTIAITRALGHSDITSLKMGVHIVSRCTAFRDAVNFLLLSAVFCTKSGAGQSL